MKFLLFLFLPISLFSQTPDYPDTLYLKSDQVHTGKIIEIEDSKIKLEYGKNKEITVYLNGVEKLILYPIGVIYTDENGFNKDVSLLQNIINQRYSSTVPAEIQVKSILEAKQDTSIHYNRSSLFLQLWGPEVLGFHFSINPLYHISINFGIGLITDIHIGMNYYLIDRKYSTSSLYIGSQLSLLHEFNPFGGSGESQLGVYIPIGYEYMARNGFTFQIDLGPNSVKEDWGQFNTKSFIASLKIGYSY